MSSSDKTHGNSCCLYSTEDVANYTAYVASSTSESYVVATALVVDVVDASVLDTPTSYH